MLNLNTSRLFIHYIKYYFLYQIALWWAITYACRILIDYPTNVVYAEGFNLPYIPNETIAKVTDSPANTVPIDKTLFERFFTCTNDIPEPVDGNATAEPTDQSSVTPVAEVSVVNKNSTAEPTDQSSVTPVAEVSVVNKNSIPEDTGNSVLSHKTFIINVIETTMKLLADKHPTTNASDIPDDSVKHSVFTALNNPDDRQVWISGTIADKDSNVSRRIEVLHAMYKDPQATPLIKKTLHHIITSMTIMTIIYEKHYPLDYNTMFTGAFYDAVAKKLDDSINSNVQSNWDQLDKNRPELDEVHTLKRIEFIEHLLERTINYIRVHIPQASNISEINKSMIQDAIITFLKEEGDIPWLTKTDDDLENAYHEANLHISLIISILEDPNNDDIPPLNLVILENVVPILEELNKATAHGNDPLQFLNDYGYSS